MCQWLNVGWLSIAAVTSGCALCVCLWRRYVMMVPVMVLCGFVLGLYRGDIDFARRAEYQPLYDTKQIIRGVVVDDPVADNRNGVSMVVSNIVINDHTFVGAVRVTLTNAGVIKRYDSVVISGKLSPGFGTYVAMINGATIKHAARISSGDIAANVRDWFDAKVRTVIPEPESGLGIGYLVGQKTALPDDINNAFRTAGLTHVVVASGYNLTILVRLARRLFAKISKYLAALVSFMMIGGFIAVTGVSPSMSRAGLVAALAILAWYYGRKFHPLVLLPFVTALTLLINPAYAWGDLGWELSFLAFAGVMVMAPLLQRYFFGGDKPSIVRQIFGETLCAQLVTAPVIVTAFGQLSIVSLIANMLILPLVPITMLLTFIAGIGALCMPFAATVIGFPAYILLKYMIETSQYVASVSWAQVDITTNWYVVAIYYGLLTVACWYMWHATRYNLRDASVVE